MAPGHVFPLRARDGGVLERVGQTEGSVDLARLAGLNPSGVICEIMNEDGTMSRMPDLEAFGRMHGIRICAVADLIKFRMRTERVVKRVADGSVDLGELGMWKTRLYRSVGTDGVHVALVKGDLDQDATLVRVQGAPPGWSFMDAGVSRLSSSAQKAMRAIHDQGKGALVLLHLVPPIESVVQGFRNDFANEHAPSRRAQAEVLRDLGTGCQVLLDLGMRDLRILSNNKRPIVGIDAYGLRIVETPSLG